MGVDDRSLTIGLLHLAPVVGDLGHNRSLIEQATVLAAEAGCDWVVSGELVATGYDFTPSLGVDWIEPLPDTWLVSYAARAAGLGIAAFVDVPELDSVDGFAARRAGSGRPRRGPSG